MDPDRLVDAMNETIRESDRTIFEDERVHPKVGAILIDKDGQIVHRGFRGEVGRGSHAEYAILQKAKEAGTDLASCTLFTSLEPCMIRGLKKVPCAQRIVMSGIRHVYIGILDPNPQVTGRGETYLSYHMTVERYPAVLSRALRQSNAAVFEKYRHDHLPVSSIYVAQDEWHDDVELRPRLVSHREGLLQQTMDLVSGSSGEIWIMAGDLSWFRELQISLLGAALDGRRIKMLCGPQAFASSASIAGAFDTATAAARSVGIEVVEVHDPMPIRGTMVSPQSAVASMIAIENRPRLHGSLFGMPADSRILAGIASLFVSIWRNHTTEQSRRPQVEEIGEADIIDALKRGVPQYENASIGIETVRVDELQPLTKVLERLKLFRMLQLRSLRSRHAIPWAARIVGSPWPITPPIVERLDDGRMVIIDGAHRVYDALSLGEEAIRSVVVGNTGTPLPGEPQTGWVDLRIVQEKTSRHDRYVNFRPGQFRPIRLALSSLVRFV